MTSAEGDLNSHTTQALMAEEKKPLDPEKGSYEQAVFTKEVDAVQIKAPPQFIGLTKEELERYRDDPFWKRLRMFLFILFWVAWITMFVAAIVIVIVSPKCPPKVVPHWWQSKMCYQIWTESFKDNDGNGVGDINGIRDKLDSLKKVGVQSIWPVQLLKSKSFTGYQVSDFNQVDSRIGTNDDLDGLIKEAHKKVPPIFMIMDFPTTTSTDHEWFKESAAGNQEFEDMYIWQTADPGDPEFYSENNGKWYFHLQTLADSPVLNWASETVKHNMTDVLKHWLTAGIDGFYVGHVQYMSGKKPAETDWTATYKALNSLTAGAKAWKNESKNEKQELLLFTSLDLKGVTVDESVYVNLVTEGGLNYVINDDLMGLTSDSIPTLAQTIADKVQTKVQFHQDNNETWPMWEIGNPYVDRIGTRMKKKGVGELMTLVLLMLPGSINHYYGDPIGMVNSEDDKNPDWISQLMRSPMQWNDEANGGFSTAPEKDLAIPVNPDYTKVNFKQQYGNPRTPLKMFRRLAKLRQTDDTFLNGNLTIGGNITDNVLTLARYPTVASGGKTIYLAAINFENATTTVDFTNIFGNLQGSGSVLTMSSGAEGFTERDPVPDLAAVTLGPVQGVVIRVQ